MSFLLERLSKKNRGEILHSSVYGQAQNQERIGVASTSVFGERLKVDQNRKVIKNYRDAQVVNNSNINSSRIRIKEKINNTQQSADNVGGMKSSGQSPMQSASGLKSSAPPARRNPGIFR